MILFYRDDAILFHIIPSAQPQTFLTAETASKIQRAVTLQLIEEDVAVEIGPQPFGIARDNYEDANEFHVSLLSLVTSLTPPALHYVVAPHVTQSNSCYCCCYSSCIHRVYANATINLEDMATRHGTTNILLHMEANSSINARVGMSIEALRRLDEAIASEVESLSLSRMEIQRYVIHSLANLQQTISTMNFMAVRDHVLAGLHDPYRFNQTKLPQLLTTTIMDGLPALGLEVNKAVQCAFAKPETTSFVLVPGGRKSLLHTSSSGMAASTLLLPLSFTWKLSCEREKLHRDHFEQLKTLIDSGNIQGVCGTGKQADTGELSVGVVDKMQSSIKSKRDGWRAELPKIGSGCGVIEIMKEEKKNGVAWQGKCSGTVYVGGSESEGQFTLIIEACSMFAHTNPLHWDMFQSAVRFEAEAVAMTAALLGRKEKASRGQVRGNMTSGGTASILMAVNSSRDYMKANPELIIPESTHSTYDKAAQHFSIKLKCVGCEFRAVVKAVRRCINRHPVLIVGSAPGFPHGIMDPIEELGELVLYLKITTELSLRRMLVADAGQSNDLRNWSPLAAPSFIQGQGCGAGRESLAPKPEDVLFWTSRAVDCRPLRISPLSVPHHQKNLRHDSVDAEHHNINKLLTTPTHSQALRSIIMAALQQSPIAFQSRSTQSPPLKNISATPVAVSFSSSLTPLKLPTLIAKLSIKKTRGGAALGARMADSAAGCYATALADVAKANGTLESTSEDLDKIGKIFSDPQVYNFFANPILDIERKRVILDEIVRSSKFQPHTANFLNLLIDMKRIELIKDIVKEFEGVFNKLTETEMAVVTSVVQLENQHLAQIAKGVQKLTGAKNVRIKTQIDPSLVAGFTIRYGASGSKLIDMSVKKQLEEIASLLDFSDIQLAAV
ncbi:hypothetical protein Nepgr_029251 [Nepenthes gracilis]|uniref:Uncharacterized protein n=1 Tax=Nepenthes gracilis TaxID=150966 RepID=A0AAD3TC58_NEPGR|nr:hypothetical protein Nepgr_029251 [Nepenthes gracilis]